MFLYKKLESKWNIELKNGDPSLLKAILKTFMLDYLTIGAFLFLQVMVFR